jgi:meso-butanediol dehydrogenase/(S,S)-butanediol dehydrogenase/diacetyl reductase
MGVDVKSDVSARCERKRLRQPDIDGQFGRIGRAQPGIIHPERLEIDVFGMKIPDTPGKRGVLRERDSLLFARAGAIVFGADLPAAEARNAETGRLADQQGLRFHAATLDVSQEAAVRDWIERGVAEAGKIDILYNNAGFAHFLPVEDLTQHHWHDTLRCELDVVFFPTRQAWPHVRRQRGGSIINVASISGSLGTPLLPGVPHAAGKGGVLGATKQFALEGAPYGIRVNAISPGPTWTPVTRAALADDPRGREIFESLPSLHRAGDPEDIAYAAVFLASDEASWITGIDLPVDGGYGSKGGVRS